MFDEVIRLLEEYTEYPREQMRPDSLLHEDLCLNSLDLMNIAVVFEDHYDLEIPEEELEKVRSIGDIVLCLEKNMNRREE